MHVDFAALHDPLVEKTCVQLSERPT
jgi:hypothetical protein